MTDRDGDGRYIKGHSNPHILSHGHSYTGRVSRTYHCWIAMRGRCLRPSHKKYPWYGARGIKICERWGEFKNFLADMGEMPEGKSLNRIDNDGNYEPENCAWATPAEQAANTSRTRFVELHGELVSVSEAARRSGIKRTTLMRRMRKVPQTDWFKPRRTAVGELA